MSAWPRQPRPRQEIPPGYALKWLQAQGACNQSLGRTDIHVYPSSVFVQASMRVLQRRPLASMQRRNATSQILKSYFGKAYFLH